MARYLTVLLLLSLSGCTAYYAKPGASAEDFYRDHYECERDAAAVRATLTNSMVRRCLAVKGWRPYEAAAQD